LEISEDATRLLASRQFVAITVRFITAGLLTLMVADPLIPTLIAAGWSLNTARYVVYPLTWLLGAIAMMIFGELIPVAYASARSESLAMLVVGPMGLLLNLLAPISRAMLWFSDRFITLFGGPNQAPYVTEEEIKTLVDAGSEEGVIEDDEKEMIYSIFQFGDKVAREIMIPRIDIVALDATTPLEQALDLVLSAGHSRIPIYEGSIDRIVGVLYAKDLLGVWRNNLSKDRAVREVMRPAYFVPESKKAADLLEDLQQRKIHMAIVIDEFGGTAGLVTIEDLLEEIVGEIQDEYDPEPEAEYQKIGDDEYLFDAGINLEEVNELLNANLSDEASDTLGGYVFSTLGKVPLAGEVFTAEGLEIRVEEITGRRIRQVRVRRIPPPSPVESTKEPESRADTESESDETRLPTEETDRR
ncbi:MAG TPA: hemolysin family protein, partial [Aggregatilineales bacterium]|nr:hemolysin family protein [Aggregatilineales bacterium]